MDDKNEIVYEQCVNCGRKFFEGKLKLHLKLCTVEHPMRHKKKEKSLKSKSQPKRTNRNQSLDRSYIQNAACHICNRKMNPRNLEHHIGICEKNYKELMYKKAIIEKQLKKRVQCKHCNYEMEIDHNFCGKCGTKKQ